MNKKELIEAVALEAGLSRSTADAAVNAVLDQITRTLEAGDKVHLVGFGTFDTRALKPRVIKDIQSQEQRRLPQRRMIVFLPGKHLKERVH